MSLFDRVKSKIKEDLIIEMNKTGDDDPWDDGDKNNKNNKNNKKKKYNNKKPKFTSGSFDPANQEKQFVDNERKKNLKKNKDSLENTFKQNTKADATGLKVGDIKLDQLKDEEKVRKQYYSNPTMGDGGEVTGTPQDQTYKAPSKDKAKEIMNKSVVNQADAGKRAKTFRQSFGTPTGADPKTGKPTYAPSYTVDAKGNKKLGPDIELPRSRTGGVPQPDKKTGLSGYDRASKTLGDREAAKKVYLNQNTKRASDKGIKQFIRKSQQMSSGSNVPVDDKQIEKIYKKEKSEITRKINQKYGGQRVNLQGTNKFKKIKNILKNKNIGKKAGAVKKFLKPVVKAAIKNPRAALVIGGLGAVGTYMGGDALRRKLRGDIGSVKDFTKTAPIVNKSTGKEVRYSYGGTNNTLPKFKNNLARDKYFTSKLKSGQFKVKSK